MADAEYKVSLDRLRLGLALMRLAKLEDNPIARTLHGKIVRAWDPMYGPSRNDRRFCTVKLAVHEVDLYRSLAIPSLLVCTYTAVYVDPQDPTVEVRVSTRKARPPKKATFNVRGGKRRLVRTEVIKHEGALQMARKPKTAAPVDELDDLDDLDDLDSDDDEDEAPAPKKETPAQKRKRLKAEAAAAEEEDDDEDDEDDEEDEEPAPKRKAKAPAAAKAKAKGTGAVGRALPEGKLGVEQVAKLAGTTGRAVRIYCRTNDIEKSEGLGRYAWTQAQGEKLAKKIKAAGSK